MDRGDGLFWALLHSGSRNVGKTVAETYIAKAKRALGAALADLPDPDLAWLTEGTADYDAYAADLDWCQRYARENRAIMMSRLLRQLAYALGFEGDASGLGHHDGGRLPPQLRVRESGTLESGSSSPGRARSPRGRGSSVSSPGRWGPAPTS